MADEKKTRAASIIDKYDGMFAGTFGIDEAGLGGEISRIILREPGVVFYVFSVLMERRYDSATIIRVARILVDSTPRAVFNQVAADWDGYQLVKLVEKILKCDVRSNRGAIRCDNLYVAAITGLTTMRHAARGDKKQAKTGDNSAQPRKLSDIEMHWYVNYFNTPDGTLGGQTKSFNQDVCWQLPRKGIGYVVYSPDDLDNPGRKRLGEQLLNDKYGFDQIGTKETIEAMIRIAIAWKAKYPNKIIQYGDVSRPGGVNTPDHKTHNIGMAWDMRLFRKDNALVGTKLNADTSDHAQFDRESTINFILLVKSLYPQTTVYFNDKTTRKELSGKVSVEARGGHWDHLHVMPFTKGRE